VLVTLVAAPALATDWFPLQATVGGQLQVDERGGSTWGAHLSANLALGRPDPRWGSFWGVGVSGFLGGTDVTSCPGVVRCAERRSGALFARYGRAFTQTTGDPADVPSVYWFVQVAGVLGSEALRGVDKAFGGARLSGGVNVFGWTTMAFGLASDTATGRTREASFLTAFAILVALLNHLEVTVEWTTPALSSGAVRFGLTFGFGV
jgi:hypothetical protein